MGRYYSMTLAIGLVAGLGACGDDDGGNQNQNTNQNGNTTIPVCGNGVVELGETCDEGAANSDSAPDACRTSCRPPFCGDGVVDASELCDDGPQNADLVPNACRADCTPARCGDGVVDASELCDQGAANSDDAPGACRLDCEPAACLDGIYDPGQVCFSFYGVAYPDGLYWPGDADGDGLGDLVGMVNDPSGFLTVNLNTGNGFAGGGPTFAGSSSYSPLAVPGRPTGPGGPLELVVGRSAPRLAAFDASGRPDLPETLVLTADQHAALGVVLSGGTRAVVTLGEHDACRVHVGEDGALDRASRACQMVGGAGSCPRLMAETDALVTTVAGTASNRVVILLGTEDDENPGKCTLHLDGEGDVVRIEPVWMPEPDRPAGWETYGQMVSPRSLGPLRRVGTDVQVAQARFVIDGNGTILYRDLGFQRFDATTETFDGTWESVPVIVTPTSDQAYEVQLAFGRFGGSGAWLDAVWHIDTEEAIQVLRHADGTGFTEIRSCPLAGTVDGLLVADLDGDGDDDVIAQLGSELRIFWQGATGLDCTPEVLALPFAFPAPAVSVARLDDDAAADLLVRLPGQSRGVVAAVVRGGNPPVVEPLYLDREISSVTALPSASDPARVDLAYTFDIGAAPSSYSDDHRTALGLVRQEQGRFLNGRLVDLGAGAVPGAEGSTGTLRDVDGDGQDDLVVHQTDGRESRVHVLLGPDDGGFASLRTTPLPYVPGLDFLADVTGDGQLDLLVLRGNPVQPNQTPDAIVLVFPFEGDGFSATPLQVETDLDPRIVLVGQFDGDGRPDLATLHPSAGVVTVLHSNAQGGFEYDPDVDRYLVPGQPVTASVLDLDGDGHDDLVVAAPQQGVGPIWLRGRGDGTFEPAVDLPLAPDEFYVSTAEMTGDAFADLVVLKGDIQNLVTVVLRGRP